MPGRPGSQAVSQDLQALILHRRLKGLKEIGITMKQLTSRATEANPARRQRLGRQTAVPSTILSRPETNRDLLGTDEELPARVA
ncbi:hypothetical protein WJX74_003573 [Apatococcus lobatus]|uniref:Uncharacterized protein n=1 Tax=Apatococcus lobatus TaxID=904363 RepID=A0AAW1SG38_9CHLO